MSKSRLSDVEIIRLLRSESHSDREEACVYLYDILKQPVISWVNKRKTGIDGEDILHEALIIFFANKSFQPQFQGSIKHYFFKIVSSLWKTKYKQIFKEEYWEDWMLFAEMNTDVVDANVPFDFEEEVDLQIAFVRETLSQMKHNERDLLVQFYCEEKSLKDLVTELNLGNTNNAKNRLFHYREKFKTLYNKIKNK